MSKPLAIDLCCGLGGWTEGLMAEGYRVIGYDIEAHEYGDEKYPGELRLESVLTLKGAQFKHAALTDPNVMAELKRRGFTVIQGDGPLPPSGNGDSNG